MPYKILIADDNKGIRLFLKELLHTEGYEIYEASNGQEAIELFSEIDFSLIIMDMKMPYVSGLEALKFMNNKLPQLPIIIVSAYPQKMLLDEMGELGLNIEFLAKPFDIASVVSCVKERLENQA